MKKKTLVVLIAIVAIAAAVLFAGCIGTTTIYDIEKHPDDYIGKKVTIDALTCPYGRPTFGGAEPNYKGFWITDKEAHDKYGLYRSAIFVKYDGDAPSHKDKWGKTTQKAVRVKGIVRYTYMRIGREEKAVFYIDGESWEYIS